MAAPHPSDREPTVFERTALDWVDRIDRGLTPEEELEFEQWLGSDPHHSEVFAELHGTWRMMDRVRETPEAGLSSGHLRPKPRAAFLPWAVAFGAAAALIVAYLGFRPKTSHEPNPDLIAAMTSDVGQTRTLDLPDGSVLQLNTDTAVEVRYSAGERRLNLLRGEAVFTVAKRPTRPFVVNAGSVHVRAVGTAFAVRLRSEAVEVLVTQGRVQVASDETSRSSASATLAPSDTLTEVGAGQKVTVTLSRTTMPSETVTVAPVTEDAISRVLAWEDHRLEFDKAPLAEIVQEINRYNRVKLVISDPTLAKQDFGGTFKADDPAGFIRALETNFGIKVEPRAGQIILRLAADPATH